MNTNESKQTKTDQTWEGLKRILTNPVRLTEILAVLRSRHEQHGDDPTPEVLLDYIATIAISRMLNELHELNAQQESNQ